MKTRPTAATANALLPALLLLLAAAETPAAGVRYGIVTDDSELRVLIWRAGPLAGFGHNHVAVSRALSGTVVLADPVSESAVELEFPVSSLELDEPSVRAGEGPAFEGVIAEDDIAATRRNMLGPGLLAADEHPSIRIESTSVTGALPDLAITARVTVRGEAHALDVPVSVNTFDGGLVAIGRLRFSHAAVGLEPFRVALGSLRVADELVVEFRIVASPAQGAAPTVDDETLARAHRAAERDDIAVLPHVGGHDLAGKYRCREARLHGPDQGEVVVADRAEYRPAGEAEHAARMQQR